MPRLFLFPGLGADARLFSRLAVPGWELAPLPFVEPLAREELPQFAKRLAQAHGLHKDDAVGGASFGGMVAAEIAAQFGLRLLVLLGSAVTPARIPRHLKALEFLSRAVPDAVFIRLPRVRSVLRAYVGPLSEADLDLLLDMERSAPPALMRRGARMIMRWRGVTGLACPVHAIHGARDRLLMPPQMEKISGGRLEVVADAGHAIALTHADRVSAFLSEALKRCEDPAEKN
ncbi:MAG: alpha/beta hydrolase [Planctomycetes bacterium]|nr:alpha/beta hydrolase [Planctomycetota bacterium]